MISLSIMAGSSVWIGHFGKTYLVEPEERMQKRRTKKFFIFKLQRLIISKGREYLSYNKYKKVINNIINKKINKIKLKNLNNFNEELYFINLSHLCSLLNKYYCIYDENIINNNIYLYRLVRHLIVIYDYNIYDNNDYTNNYCKLIKYYDLYSELRYI